MGGDDIERLVKGLQSPLGNERLAAIHVIQKRYVWDSESLPPSIAPLLADLLADDEAALVEAAAFLLGELRYAPAAPALAAIYRQPEHPAHNEARHALRRIGAPAVEYLIFCLADPDPSFQAETAILLYHIGTYQALKAVAAWRAYQAALTAGHQ